MVKYAYPFPSNIKSKKHTGEHHTKFIESKFVMDSNLLKKISKYSMFIMLTGSGVIILGYTDSIMLTYFSGLAAVGLYNVALPTAKILLALPNAFGSVLLPLTSELWVKKNYTLLKAGVESLYKYSMIVTIPMAIVMFSFAELLIEVLFGKNFVLAGAAMKILAVGMIFATIHAIHSNFFQGIGKPEVQSKIIYISALFNLAGNLIMIPLFGIAGAAISTSLSYLIMMLIGLIQIRKFIKIEFPIKIWIKILAAGLMFIFVISLLKRILLLNVWLEAFLVLAVSGMVYAALLFILKVIGIGEIKNLYERIAK